MKLLTFEYEGKRNAGILLDDEKTVYKITVNGEEFEDLGQVIEKIDGNIECIKKSDSVPFENVKIIAPIPFPKQDIICLGINYMAHAEESARYKKEAFGGDRPFAVYFSKELMRLLVKEII